MDVALSSAPPAADSVVRATAAGLRLAASLQRAIEAQYDELEARLGRAHLTQLYALLDELIALQASDDEEETDDMADISSAAHPLIESAA